MTIDECPRLPKDDPSGHVYDYAAIDWPVEYVLLHPIESDARGRIERVEIREPLVSDLRAMSRIRDRTEASIRGVSLTCGLSTDEVGLMASRDYTTLSAFLTDFLA